MWCQLGGDLNKDMTGKTMFWVLEVDSRKSKQQSEKKKKKINIARLPLILFSKAILVVILRSLFVSLESSTNNLISKPYVDHGL